MNRQQRRKAVKKGLVHAFDPNTHLRLKYEISVPGADLRGDYPATYSGVIESATEADQLRSILLTLLNTYGYAQHQKAAVGCIAEALNPLPNSTRGGLAYCLIEGQGLLIYKSVEQVCDDPKCGAVLEEGLHPDPEPGQDGTMLDITRHAPECHVNREVDPERPERPLHPAAYKPEEIVNVANPVRYEPLNKSVDPETGGGLSTVDEVIQSTEEEDGRDDARTAPNDADLDAEPRFPVGESASTPDGEEGG